MEKSVLALGENLLLTHHLFFLLICIFYNLAGKPITALIFQRKWNTMI